ncbi:hypothetical protein CRENBAI_017049 [Crenichthys baileyi]|uniref:Uncharacterized protein n=1 Tax=Crenichthys baileyi TaxID=28760 RepID=A0AAV9R7J9_9TELE
MLINCLSALGSYAMLTPHDTSLQPDKESINRIIRGCRHLHPTFQPELMLDALHFLSQADDSTSVLEGVVNASNPIPEGQADNSTTVLKGLLIAFTLAPASLISSLASRSKAGSSSKVSPQSSWAQIFPVPPASSSVPFINLQMGVVPSTSSAIFSTSACSLHPQNTGLSSGTLTQACFYTTCCTPAPLSSLQHRAASTPPSPLLSPIATDLQTYFATTAGLQTFFATTTGPLTSCASPTAS